MKFRSSATAECECETLAKRRPNFFVIGAPKCGTTSLAAWLGQHPAIFIPSTKEPHFFNADDRRDIVSLDAYERLFAMAGDRHRAVGEASVWYLSSSVAVPNILRYQPDAKFVVMIRNPIEMAPALHAELLASGQESIGDFRAAWMLQAERRHGRRLPLLSWSIRRFLYGDVCSLGAQLQRVLDIVPADRVLTILLEDIINDPRREYLRVVNFLGVNDDGREEFPVRNQAKALRWPVMTRALLLAVQIKDRLGIRLNLGIWQRVVRANTIARPRDPLPPDLAGMLQDHFADDVALLGRLLGRDLRHWLSPQAGKNSGTER